MSYWQDHGILAVLVDVGFLNNANRKNLKLEFSSVFDNMNPQGLALLRNYFYDCRPYVSQTPTPDEQEKIEGYERFISYIEQIPQTECKFGRLQKIDNSYTQKGVDTLLAIDIVALATKRLITHISLFTGDSDLIPAIQAAKNEGVIVNLYTTKQSVNDELVAACDIVYYVDDKWFQRCSR